MFFPDIKSKQIVIFTELYEFVRIAITNSIDIYISDPNYILTSKESLVFSPQFL